MTVRDTRFVLFLVFLIAGAAAIIACAADSPPPVGDPDPANATDSAPVNAAGSVPAVGQEPASGFKGKALRGPVMAGPQVGDDPGYAPFSATFFVNDRDGNEVARFQSDDEGAFELLLPPGDYVIVPEPSAPVFRPAEQPQSVTVPEDEIVELTLRYDTGIR